MVHGMGFRDGKYINYWGRIPKVFENHGCEVFYGNQDSNGTVEENGRSLRQRIYEILETTGSERLNVIAHSKGGLDMRYAISGLGMGGYIASLTTVSTPHHGSKTVDKILKLPTPLVRFVGKCSDLWLRMCGDENPDAYNVYLSFSTDFAEKFNIQNPDDPRVYYQSYAFKMNNALSDMIMMIPYTAVYLCEGENDGLLTPDSAKWGDFKGIVKTNSNRGISHCDEVDLRRRKLSGREGSGVSDITEVYGDILKELKKRGF